MTTAWGSVWRRLSAWSTLVWQISHSRGRLSGRLWPKYSASSVTARLAPRRWISTLRTSSSLSMSVVVCSGAAAPRLRTLAGFLPRRGLALVACSALRSL